MLRDQLPERIESIDRPYLAARLYIFSVENNRCYAVGQRQILVHNTKPISCSGGDLPEERRPDGLNAADDSFDFGAYLRSKIGGPPEGMIDPHAHHTLFKKGLGPKQQALVEEGQAILRKVGIDPIMGLENLVWAPMRVTRQHSLESLKTVVDTLRTLD